MALPSCSGPSRCRTLSMARGGAMLDQPVIRPTVPTPTDLPDAADAQIREANERVRGNAVDAGVGARLADAAIHAARACYRIAHLHPYVGAREERGVGEALHLRPKP